MDPKVGPLIPLAVPNLAGNEARYLQECIETTFVSSVGPFVDRFEEMVSRAAGARYGVATSAGTTGLHVALTAVGVERDDLVILPTHTFIASANAIAHCGATPWLFDVEPTSWNLDPDQVRRALAEETDTRDGRCIHRPTGRRVSAIMPVHAAGLPADMDPLVAAARTHGLPLVADGAAALGARYKGRAVGELGADLTVFSFNGNKTVTAGGGGVVVGDDESLCALARHLTTTARIDADYDHDRIGFNYRMTNLQAAVGCAQMEQLDAFVAAKRRISSRYGEALGNHADVGLFPDPNEIESACWFSGVTLKRPAVARMVSALRQQGIEARPFWKPMHLQQPYLGAPRASLRVCDGIWKTILTLPCSTGLTRAEQDRVIAAVQEQLRP